VHVKANAYLYKQQRITIPVCKESYLVSAVPSAPDLNINTTKQISTKPCSLLITHKIYILSKVYEIILLQSQKLPGVDVD
jgi:hypothetical protein